MQEQEQNTQEREQVAEKVEPIAIYQNNIYALVDDVKNDPQYINKTDEELKQDKSFFPTLVNYIYNNYLGDLLGNKHGRQIIYKDINQLDYIFNIYVSLVYKYKWNNRPLIVEYCLLTGIARDTIYNWANGLDNNTKGVKVSQVLTRERSDIVKKWIETCERALLDGQDTIKDIFILKAKYNYRDSDNKDIIVNINPKAIVSAEELPKLSDLKSNN